MLHQLFETSLQYQRRAVKPAAMRSNKQLEYVLWASGVIYCGQIYYFMPLMKGKQSKVLLNSSIENRK
jgi:hypothetical protein